MRFAGLQCDVKCLATVIFMTTRLTLFAMKTYRKCRMVSSYELQWTRMLSSRVGSVESDEHVKPRCHRLRKRLCHHKLPSDILLVIVERDIVVVLPLDVEEDDDLASRVARREVVTCSFVHDDTDRPRDVSRRKSQRCDRSPCSRLCDQGKTWRNSVFKGHR